MLELLLLINMSRVNPVEISESLTKVAEERADYLCNNEFSHEGWGQQKYMVGYSYRGENLAKGFKKISKAHKAFLNSPTHKAVIVNDKFTHVGIAISKCGVIVEEFGGLSPN